jgi:hypothetical protein
MYLNIPVDQYSVFTVLAPESSLDTLSGYTNMTPAVDTDYFMHYKNSTVFA